MDPIGRFFLCACCHQQTVICSTCDHGQIYCSSACAKSRRSACLREAGQRYQRSERGRIMHAQRMARYRALSASKAQAVAEVTHQGSVSEPDAATLPIQVPQSPAPRPPFHTYPSNKPWRCQVCQRGCAAFVRLGPLTTFRRDKLVPARPYKPPYGPPPDRQGRFEPSEGEVAR